MQLLQQREQAVIKVSKDLIKEKERLARAGRSFYVQGLKIRFQNILLIETEDMFGGFFGSIYQTIEV